MLHRTGGRVGAINTVREQPWSRFGRSRGTPQAGNFKGDPTDSPITQSDLADGTAPSLSATGKNKPTSLKQVACRVVID